MKVVVVTGHSGSGIETVWQLMRSLGVAAPALAHSATDDPAVFHHKLFLAQEVGLAEQPGQITPGRMWHGRAENLLINNVESQLWGWGEARSSRLLEFWAGVDPCTHFVLLYVPPEVALAMAPTAGPGIGVNAEHALVSWRLKNSELLDFYSRHRDRSLLINTCSLMAHPQDLRALLTDRLSIELPAADQEQVACIDFPVSAVRSFLARTFLEDTEAIALYQELETASDRPADPDYYRYEATRAGSEYARLVDAQAQLEGALSKVDQTRQLLADVQGELKTTRAQLQQAESKVKTSEQTQTQLRQQIESLQKNLGQTQQTADEHSKENELLLLQLHQVQEELETYYLKYREIQATQHPASSLPTAPANKSRPLNGQNTLADQKGLIGTYLAKRKTARKLKRKIAMIRKSGLFDEQWYLKEYPDVAQAGMDPIRHYLKFGAQEGRDPSLDFDTRYYQHTNPDISDSSVNPLIHYIAHGQAAGRLPRAA